MVTIGTGVGDGASVGSLVGIAIGGTGGAVAGMNTVGDGRIGVAVACGVGAHATRNTTNTSRIMPLRIFLVNMNLLLYLIMHPCTSKRVLDMGAR